MCFYIFDAFDILFFYFFFQCVSVDGKLVLLKCNSLTIIYSLAFLFFFVIVTLVMLLILSELDNEIDNMIHMVR